jgi:hypothetical protein
MKKTLSFIGMLLFVGCLWISCSKDVETILPSIKVSLKDGGKLLDSINTALVLGASKGEFLVITGTGREIDEQKVLIYLKEREDGEFKVNIDAASLLSFNLNEINSSTVIYYVSKTEYYLLVDGTITVTGSKTKLMSGTISGKMIPADVLTSGLSLESILELFESNLTVNGSYKAYTIKM